MDPQATLTDLLQAVADRDWDRVDELAETLRTWLSNGDFPPKTLGTWKLGQKWHQALSLSICDLARSEARNARKRRKNVP
ncbi:MAG: hypothetical protein KF777_24945 [Planctomycetaceae bacterium]|nr:hypothetical protein [Planctomycetaceae bacterium]